MPSLDSVSLKFFLVWVLTTKFMYHKTGKMVFAKLPLEYVRILCLNGKKEIYNLTSCTTQHFGKPRFSFSN